MRWHELVEVRDRRGTPWRCSRTRAGRSGSAARGPRAGPSGWRSRGRSPRPRRGGSAGARRPAPRAACPCRSRAFLRKVDLSSLIQLWMQLRISSSGRCAPGDPEGRLGRLRVGGPGASGAGAGCRRSSRPSAGARAGTVERSSRSASSIPFQQRWLIILRPSRPQEGPVGLAQEVEDHPPLRRGRASARRRRPGTRCRRRRETKWPMRSAIASSSFRSSVRNGPSSARGIASV